MEKVRVDHFMWGAPDLDAGMREAERLFGVRAAPGGSHPSLGTRNALLSLGEAVYLEIIAPDPEQRLEGTFGERLRSLDTCALITWAARSTELTGLSAELKKLDMGARGPSRTRRATPGGELLEWDLLFPQFPEARQFGGTFPFFIDWLACPHPATNNPPGGTFRSLRIDSPHAMALSAALTSLGLEVDVREGAPGIEVEVDTSGSTVTLTSTPQSMELRF